MLRMTNVCKYYGTTPILHDLHLTVKEKSIVGLAGPSGSGKSTLLRCIQQLEKPQHGEIAFAGKTGFMFQDFQLFPHLTVLQNLLYAPKRIDPSNHHEETAARLLTQLDLLDKQHAYPAKLSGGQKQRAALARSLMLHPQLLLCDEPTSGLDVLSTQDVVTLLQTVRSLGVTMIIASHDLDFLTQVADRIVVLKKGSIALDIEPKNLEAPVDFLKNYYEDGCNESSN